MRTTKAYVGEKKRTDQRAIIETRPARHVNRTLLIFSNSTGIIGSEAKFDSINRNPAKAMGNRIMGVMAISGEARLYKSKKTDVAWIR